MSSVKVCSSWKHPSLRTRHRWSSNFWRRSHIGRRSITYCSQEACRFHFLYERMWCVRYADWITELFQDVYLCGAKLGSFSKTWNVMTRPKTGLPACSINHNRNATLHTQLEEWSFLWKSSRIRSFSKPILDHSGPFVWLKHGEDKELDL